MQTAQRPRAHAAWMLTTLALAVMQTSDALAQSAALEPVLVTADPLDRNLLDLQRPVSVLRGDALRLRESTNLGDTLGRELGVQSSAYGPGAGRPIIRGMDSARVRITESGLGVADVSGASPDHRVAADTLNARQVEVLRGPSTLLYGSGAIGGLVNIVSERVPQVRAAEFGAQATLRASTAERERAGAVDLNGPLGTAASWRIEGFKQKTSDYDLAAPLRDAAGDVIAADRLPNSQTDTQSAALGASWFGEAGRRIGMALQRYESNYGIPSPGEPVTIELRRDRYELHGDHAVAFGPFSGLRSKFAYTDYKHTEFEPSGEAGATFTNRGLEGRVELPHAALAGWRGVVGVQLSQNTTRGVGEGELPKVEAQQAALFVVEERTFGSVRAELGARVEHEGYDVKESYADGTRAPSRDFSLFTLSAGAGWRFAPAWEATLTLTAGQRAPAVEELYFVGAHPATFAYEFGDPKLKKEQSTNLDLGLRYVEGPWRAQANVFVNRVRNYIYGFFDGTTTDLLDENGNVEETFSNLFFTQADARLRGGEAELVYGESTGVQARLWGDTVRAKLTSGANRDGNLPRISPSRLGLDLGWRADAWSATLFVTRVFEQDKVSSFDLRDGVAESATPGYTRVDLGLVWRLPLPTVAAPLTLFLQGRNLTDQDIRVHTSFLKGVAPPPGRSVVLGLRAAI
jgi:iron complex outermembrane receptor protein